MGGSNQRNYPYAKVNLNETYEHEASSPHDTRGLKIWWNKTNSIVPAVAFGIPYSNKDVTAYTYLSFRVTQIYDHSYNQQSDVQNFRIRLKSGAAYRTVKLSWYGYLEYPDKNEWLNLGTNVVGDDSRSTFKTYCIPLADFGSINLKNLTAVEFRFDQKRGDSGPVKGAIILDSIQFTK